MKILPHMLVFFGCCADTKDLQGCTQWQKMETAIRVFMDIQCQYMHVSYCMFLSFELELTILLLNKTKEIHLTIKHT